MKLLKNAVFCFTAVGVIFLFLSQPSFAGQAVAPVLQMGAGAALPAMGGAGQASTAGPVSLHYNPAGLARGGPRGFEFTYQSIVEGINYGNVDFSRRFAENLAGGFGFRYLDYGSVDETVITDDLVTDVGSFNDADFIISGGFAWNYNNFSLGVTARLLQLESGGESAQTESFDVGLQWYLPAEFLPAALGVTAQNLGSEVKFENENEELPELYKVGATLFLEPFIDEDIRLHCDIEYHDYSSETYLRAGAEWNIEQMVSLRLGYDGSVDIDNGLTYGLGWNLTDYDIKIDYALIPYGDFGNLHRIAFIYYLL